MKKSFFLYFLVFSPLIFSQNTAVNFVNDLENNPIYQLDNFEGFSEKNFIIVDSVSSYSTNNSWITEPTAKPIENDENEFTTFLLIKQLEELNFKTPFHIEHNPTLERYIRVFLKDRREKLATIMDRASYYFPIFEEYLDKYDIPLELKYLAIVESALVADAGSPAGAKGLWQFMYGTGKQFDLEINSYIDERFDPIKSTEAACKYLSSLYKTFNDWDLALAAYNSGPGNVSKAIKRAGGKTNYWEIRKYLPQETQGYLPAFYATFYIFEFAKTHHLEPVKSSLSYIEVDTVHVKKQISFQHILEKTTISYDLLKSLNPQYKKEIIPQTNNKSYVLTLPIEMVNSYITNTNKHNSDQKNENLENTSFAIKITPYNSYKVEIGDNLNKIATKHNITLAELKKWNGLQTDYVIAEQRLVITDKNSSNSLTFETIPEEKTTPFSPEISPIFSSDISSVEENTTAKYFETYTVKEGDTLFKISRRYPQVTINQIREWNNINKIHYLKPGTQLKIF